MNTTSVERAFSITPTVSGTFSWSEDNKTMTFTPIGGLRYNTLYTVTIANNATDLSGINLSENYIWSFITEILKIHSSYTETPPKIDGAISEGEWANPIPITLNGFYTPENTKGGLLYIMNDNNNLYVAVVIPDEAQEADDYLMLDFDQGNDHVARNGKEDACGFNVPWLITGYVDCYWNGTIGWWDTDATSHGNGEMNYSNGNYTYEFSKPLNSGDAQDMSVNPGGTIGFRIETYDLAHGDWYRYPQNTVDANTTRWKEWADLILATAPKAPVVAPKAPGGGGKAPTVAAGETSISTTAVGEVTVTTIAKSADGKAAVTIPAGIKATIGGAPITKITIKQPSVLPATPPPNVDYVNYPYYAYEFGPTGAKFSVPVEISFAFDPAKFKDATPTIYMYEAGWKRLDTTIVDNKAIAKVDHFTTFALFAEKVAPSPTPTPPLTPTPSPTVTMSPLPSPSPMPSPSPSPTPGFEALFAVAGLLAIAYLVLRRRK